LPGQETAHLQCVKRVICQHLHQFLKSQCSAISHEVCRPYKPVQCHNWKYCYRTSNISTDIAPYVVVRHPEV